MLVVGTFTLTGVRPASQAPADAASQVAAVSGRSLAERRHVCARAVRARCARRGIPSDVIDGRLVRDPRLDRYLAAHKQFAGTSALGVPSVFLRGETVDTTPSR